MIREIEDEETEVTFSPHEEDRVVRDRLSEVNMIRQYAAESIQDCYRRYIACKPYKKNKKISESEKLVYHLASDTIKKFFAFKFYKKKQNRIKKYEEKRSFIEEAKNSSNSENKLILDTIDDVKYIHEEYKSPQAKSSTPVSQAPYSRSLISNRYDDDGILFATNEDKSFKDCIDVETNNSDGPLLVHVAEAKHVDNHNAIKMASKESKGALNNFEAKSIANTTRMKAKKGIKIVEAKNNNSSEQSSAKGSKEVGIQEVHNTTKVSKAPGKSVYKIPSTNPDNTTRNKLVIDEALEAAMRAECSVIKLNIKEVTMILDALGYEITTDIQNENNEFSSHNHALICELPMLNAPSLAATLSAFAKENKLVFDNKHFQISESKAIIAVRHLTNLVQGPWSKIRSILLQLTKYEENLNDDNFSGLRKIKPSQWNSKYTNIYLRSLQIVNRIGDNSIDINNSVIDGEELLTITRPMLRDIYGIIPSILQHRFCLYQHVLKLLNSWWNKGIRPDDTYIASKMADSTKNSISTKSKDYKWGVFEGIFALGDDIPSLNGLELSNRVDVYVAPFSDLMQAWVPLNRGYGWNIPFEQLNMLGNVVGDSCGYIYRSSTSMDSNTDISDIKGHRWVTLYKNNIELSGSEINDIIDSIVLGENISKVAKYSFDNSCFSVLVPILCLRPNKSAPSSVKVSKSSSNTAVIDEIEIGKLYRIANDQCLRRACERFDWWDRPSPAILSKMAGNVGEVVATSELQSRQRVGIRVKDTLIVDALPLECLLDMNEGIVTDPDLIDDRNTDVETEDKKRNSKKNKGKKKKSSKKKVSSLAVVKLLSNSKFGNEEFTVGIKGLPENVTSASADALEDNLELDLESIAPISGDKLTVTVNNSDRNIALNDIIIVPSPTKRNELLDDVDNQYTSHESLGQKRPLYRPASSPEQISLYRPTNTFSPVASFDDGSNVGIVHDPSKITNSREINSYYFGDELKENRVIAMKLNPSKPLLDLDGVGNEAEIFPLVDHDTDGGVKRIISRPHQYVDNGFDDTVISIPSPRQEATDYSWLRSKDRFHLHLNSIDAKEVECQTTQRDNNDRINVPMLSLDTIANDEVVATKSPVPMLNICVPVFDSENAVFADGISRYYDKESMTATKIAARPLSVPSYIRKVKNLNNHSNNRDRLFAMEDDLPDSPIKDGSNITIKGNPKPLAVSTERAQRKVVNRKKEEDEDELMKQIHPVSPTILPRPPKGRSKQLEFDANIIPDKVIDRVDFVDGNFGVEGRGVNAKEINWNIKIQDQSENKPSTKKQNRPKSALGSSHKNTTQTKVEDVQLGLAATNINIQKRPKSALNPTSLAEHVQRRLERGNDIVDSMDVNEEEFLRREFLRSSQENRSKEKWLEKQIEEISKM